MEHSSSSLESHMSTLFHFPLHPLNHELTVLLGVFDVLFELPYPDRAKSLPIQYRLYDSQLHSRHPCFPFIDIYEYLELRLRGLAVELKSLRIFYCYG